MTSISSTTSMAVALVFVIMSPYVEARSASPAPYGTSIDQVIACVLMLLALVLTYIIHPSQPSSYSYSFF
ncbi:hypothetical protein V6N13_004949 [Hibiscus sabdariffa]|uniref:Uncharacterized protein n=1 Tax=Hibiscus sabdariffa TaxID=183260 RepID=A0ABR2S011_9ROSI